MTVAWLIANMARHISGSVTAWTPPPCRGSTTPFANDLLPVVMDRESTACSLWLGLEQQFNGNKETCAMILHTEHNTFVQADLSITDYCYRLKSLANSFSNLDQPVLDRSLVLAVAMLRGLDDKFAYMETLIRRTNPLPSFVQVRSELLLSSTACQTKV
ncbi:hypothetical protein ACP70R_045197 [Stipagrostis hirtigluma subsp. patula]